MQRYAYNLFFSLNARHSNKSHLTRHNLAYTNILLFVHKQVYHITVRTNITLNLCSVKCMYNQNIIRKQCDKMLYLVLYSTLFNNLQNTQRMHIFKMGKKLILSGRNIRNVFSSVQNNHKKKNLNTYRKNFCLVKFAPN